MQYIDDIKSLLAQSRQKTYQTINSIMVETYWKIGEKIVLEEQNGKNRANYGEAVLKTLSIALTQEFGKGFSYANLRNIRQFYYTYPDFEICYTLCSKLTWSHNRLIMRVENSDARTFYLSEAAQQQWKWVKDFRLWAINIVSVQKHRTAIDRRNRTPKNIIKFKK